MAAEYVEVESGRKSDRPQLRAALAHAKSIAGVLIIAKLDRLARNVAFIANLMESRVKFIAADRPDAKAFELHIYAAMAEEEARMISERTTRALAVKREQLAAQGRRLGNPSPEASLSKGRATQADSAAAFNAPVREILAQHPGKSLNALAAVLNGMRLPTRRGGTWTAKQVSRVLA